MQIPPASSASQAASILSQASSKDKSSGTGATAAEPTQAQATQVERSESASADRDAQGQGDGLADRGSRSQDEIELSENPAADENVSPAAGLPGEPPSQLDIIG